MRSALIDLVINYLLDAKNFQWQFKDENSKEYCKEMDWLIGQLKMMKDNKTSDEKKLLKYLMYGDLIKECIDENLDIFSKRLTLEQKIGVINEALELDEITGIEIASIIRRTLKR